MSEARIGRIVVAALHQALADHLPLRLEFYETYLRPSGMRAGTIGVASFSAALSFLRAEGQAYDPVVRAAGHHAAEWVFATLPAIHRAWLRRLPGAWRTRSALKLTARLTAMTVRGARGRITGSRGHRRLVVEGSPFCGTRLRPDTPLCGFYAAALQRFFDLLAVTASADAVQCRATGAEACVVEVAAVDPVAVVTPQHSGGVL